MPMQSTVERIALELSRVLSPLQSVTGSLDNFINFLLTELGWNVNDIPQSVRNLTSTISKLSLLTKDIGDTDTIDSRKLTEITATLVHLTDEIKKISQGSAAGLLPELIAEEFLHKLPDELLQYLLVEYLRGYHPLGYATLQLLGITALERVEEVTAARHRYVKRTIHWSYCPDILTKPRQVFADLYGWGRPDFDFLQLASNLAEFFNSLGCNTYLAQMENAVAKVLEEKTDPETNLIKYFLKIPFTFEGENASDADFGIGLFALPQNNRLAPGFAILPYGKRNTTGLERLTDELSFSFQTNFEVTDGIGIIVRPGQDIKIVTGFEGEASANTASGSLKVGLVFSKNDGAPIRLITVTNAIYIELRSVGIYGGVDLRDSSQKDLFAEFELKEGNLVIDTGSADSFLSTILPKGGLRANFDLVFGISVLKGAYFKGGGGLEIQLPTHIALGPVDIQSLTISVIPKEGVIPLNVGANVKAVLGPLQVVLENIGFTGNLSFPESGGNLGQIDLSLGFKPPNGVGLTIDTDMITGGGHLSFDFNRQEYVGVLELSIAQNMTTKAIGLITTQLPDGAQGFTLLILLNSDFGSGIQLGYGFRLLSVGGLLGLNRTVRLQSLLEGVRTGALTSLMFPRDVATNAPRIISDLRTLFPPEEGKFLIGPMAKLGWGTPTLVSISLGLVIEIPGNTTILGVLRVALPDEDRALIVLQADFLGEIELTQQRLFFFSALFDSRVLSLSIDGEMGVVASYGDDANFLISVGGFHPGFTPPPLPFPAPARIAVNVLNESYARIRLEGYFAVTTNTVQFGALAEAYFGFSAFSIEGHLAFDALLQFAPLHFIIAISASFALKVFGLGLFDIRVRFSLEGPTPWRAAGTGAISFFFFDIDVDFDFTWGERRDTALPPIAVLPLLVAELENPSNWRAQLPIGAQLLVSLRHLDAAESAVVLHPFGTLRVSQRAVPLDVRIDKIGNQKSRDVRRLSLQVISSGFTKQADLTESFAPAQFQEFDDAARLSRPAYVQEHSGIEFSVEGEQLASSAMVKHVIRDELVTIDTQYRRAVRRSQLPSRALFSHFLNGSSVTRSPLSMHQQKKRKPFAEKIQVHPDTYVVALQSTNKIFDPQAASFTSEAMAREYLHQQIVRDPHLADALHVILGFEVAV